MRLWTCRVIRRGDVDCGATQWLIYGPAHTANRSAHAAPQASGPRCAASVWPTPRRMIKLGVLAALAQRIVVRYHVNDMSCEEGVDYLRHRLALAGRT